MGTRGWVRVIGSLLLLVAMAACSSASSSSSSSTKTVPSIVAYSPTDPTAAKVASTWEAFFSGTMSASQKIPLLQNGQQFAAIIQGQASSPMAKGASAKVSDITVTSPTTATVKYSILLGGQVALANQTGQAILVAGSWKVADPSFCALLSLEGQTVPMCPSASPGASPTG